MSKVFSVHLHFLEPFRLAEWKPVELRNAGNKDAQRTQGYARWHKSMADKLGRPYITGTLLRSAVIRAAEEELARCDGYWEGELCCQGHYSAADKQPSFHRHRPTLKWNDKKETCDTHSPKDACPLCLLLNSCKNSGSAAGDTYNIHFSNLDLQSRDLNFIGPQEIGSQRLLNRIETYTGKALDTFRIWEVDGVHDFYGTIQIAEDLPKKDKVISLLTRALGFVDRLCGAICIVVPEPEVSGKGQGNKPTVQQHGHQYFRDKALALRRLFPAEYYPQSRIREIADAFRAIRSIGPDNFSLPMGHLDKNGDCTEHYVWDIHLTNEKSLRSYLVEQAKEFAGDGAGFARYCTMLGQEFFELSKERTSPRPHGPDSTDLPYIEQAEPYPDPEHEVRIPPVPSFSANPAEIGLFTHEWIITGNMVAATPFYIGIGTEEDDHTNLKVLLDRHDHFRLPRSVMRGVLRRDFGIANGQGCQIELGPDNPCICAVCTLLRCITIMDSTSSYDLPADIRHRIRKAARMGTAEDGALFDQEIGPENVSFPFVLRYRGGAVLPKDLMQVLTWWTDGILFLGGDTGNGRGRFELQDIRVHSWDLASENHRSAYVELRGLRGSEHNPESWPEMTTPASGLAEVEFCPVSPAMAVEYPWLKIAWSLDFESPVLTNDSIEALISDEADAVYFQKTIAGQDQKVPALRGEGMRGLLRTALARSEKTDFLTKDHEDCSCPQCLVFGNVHRSGKIRVEDMKADVFSTKRLDHNSIDRSDLSVHEKFDDRSLIGSPDKPLLFSGHIWIHNDLDDDLKNMLINAFLDIKHGLYAIGSKGGIGYGAVKKVGVPADSWLGLGMQKALESATTPSTSPPRVLQRAKVKERLPHPAFSVVENGIYNPYYFLPLPESTPSRTKQLVWHDHLDQEKFTGKITCTLKAVSPLILSDTENDMRQENEKQAHRQYPPYKLNGTFMIPGAQIRGAISQVFESLTNSCFRVMDQKRRLSWRMDADDFQNFRPGMVSENANLIIEVLSYRLPLYDDFRETGSLEDLRELKECLENSNKFRQDKIKSALKVNKIIAAAAKDNRGYLNNLNKKDPEEYERVMAGRSRVGFSINDKLKSPHDKIACLSSTGPLFGFVKISGPNNANVEIIAENSQKENYSDKLCNPLGFLLTGPHECRVSNKKTYPRPGFSCIKGNSKYTISKRCERIFLSDKNSKKYTVSNAVKRAYRELIAETRRNTSNLPQAFRTKIAHSSLQDGDLVYFKPTQSGDQVESVIPVSIFREQDIAPLGIRMRSEFRTCANVCVEECDQCSAKNCPIPLYREGYPVNGLCPACHLFGSQMYKGRVSFGFAQPIGNSDAIETIPVTLPEQDRPRLTWVMPKETRGDLNRTLPGRKWYLRHDGWRVITEEGINPSTEEKIQEGPNNSSHEAIKEGQKFRFDLSFENLHDWELGQLLYCLELESGMSHALGRGKPFGFGNFEIKIEHLFQRLSSKDWINHDIRDITILDLQIVKEGLQKLVKDCNGGNGETPWYELAHIKGLRALLTRYPDIDARYPKLSEDKTGKPPGYVELKTMKSYQPHKELSVRVSSEASKSICIMPWHLKWQTTQSDNLQAIEPGPRQPAKESLFSGSIKWFNWQKRYGFILEDNGKGKENLFVHINGLSKSISKGLNIDGLRVKYRRTTSSKGKLEATEVTLQQDE